MKKIQAINYMRGLSIFFIVLYHFCLEISNFQIRPQIGNLQTNLDTFIIFRTSGVWNIITNIVFALFSIGWQFVGIFLLISGFGLTYSRLQKKSNENFLIKRFKRLFPFWHIAILFAFIINLLGHTLFYDHLISKPTLEFYPYFYSLLMPFIIDFSFDQISKVNPSLWFIILIMEFYIFYDVLYLWLMKVKLKRFIIYSALITFVFRFILIQFFHQQSPMIENIEGRTGTLFNSLPARLLEFTVGMALAYLVVKKENLLRLVSTNVLLSSLILWIIGMICTWSIYGMIFSDCFLTLGLAPLLFFICSHLKNGYVISILDNLGSHSYTIYLFHNPVITMLIVPIVLILGEKYNPAVTSLIGLAFISSVMVGTSLRIKH